MSTMICFAVLQTLALFTNFAGAQITPDETLPVSSSVQLEGKTFNITGGMRVGNNLLHSFAEFSVPNGATAFFDATVFDDATKIQNIISRVTGKSVSNIDGLIKASGTANLFLINPSGIVFGSNASLNIGGSFVASTASSVKFADGEEYSATDPQVQPLLSVSVPVGLQYGQNPASIVNEAVNLQVQPGKTLALLPARSQIFPDNTLPSNSTVRSDLQTSVIEGGTRVGSNLFHSFESFSLPTFNSAYFNNAVDIKNIIARVTGSSPYNINGSLQTNGTANLFLINPNGIIFGNYASLNVGGSFVATTANAIQFGNQGFFSASVPNNPLPLTVDPSAFLFNQIATYPIQNYSAAPIIGFSPSKNYISTGLHVPDGQSLLLLGGNINMDGGGLNAFGGRVELGGLAGAGTVGLNTGNNLSLIFYDTVQRASVSLTNEASVYVGAATGSGSIAINAQNLNVSNQSKLYAGINEGLEPIATTAGNITLDATGAIEVNGASYIFNYVEDGALGNGGNITIKSRALSLGNDSQIGTVTYGNRNAGSVLVQASDSVSLRGTQTAIKSNVGSRGTALSILWNKPPVGNSGDITIFAKSVSLDDGAQLSTVTFGRGNAGNVLVQASESVSLSDPGTAIFSSVGFPPSTRAVGKSGNIIITDKSLAVGNSGNIAISAKSLGLTNGAQIIASSFAQGNAGSVRVQVDDSVSLIGGPMTVPTVTDPPFFGSSPTLKELSGRYINGVLNAASTGIFSTVESEALGNAGDIEITARALELSDGALIQSMTRGQGNAGNIRVDALDIVNIFGFSQKGGFSSGLLSSTEEANGQGGDITVNTNALRLSDGAVFSARTLSKSRGGNINIGANTVDLSGGGQLLTSAFSSGNAGDITVNGNDKVTIFGSDPTYTSRLSQFGSKIVDNESSNSGLFARVTGDQTANAGKLKVITGDLTLRQGTLTTETKSGEGGDITLNIRNILQLRNNSNITTTAGTAGQGGNGGNIDINAPSGFIVASNENNDITANAFTGSGGNVTINAYGIFGIEFQKEQTSKSDITASSKFGINGNVQINTPNVSPKNGLVSLPTVPVDTKIASGCTAVTSQEQSSFVVTGRGGLPLNPREAFNSNDTVRVDWVTLNPSSDNRDVENISTHSTTTPSQIVEATGWLINTKGEVLLTANPPNSTPHTSSVAPTTCQAPEY
ncbi:filamentous hemagglutinin outer membrane protein [Calothrix sp. NIES-4071]|nr:filamentous hemagglutinin outer membrane protein [Calothrix sp. NIES-4071]BAZ56303.1 filamentous hemagglutinin outer membrane protein [Calothrix sp. NIES-4105]